MSHFPVAVIVKDAANAAEAVAKADEALEPFDENRPMKERIELVSDDELQRMVASYRGEGQAVPAWDATSETDRTHLTKLVGDYFTGNPENGVWNGETYGYRVIFNPAARWDWYQVGGRWRGFYMVKDSAKDYAVGEAGAGGNAVLGPNRADVARVKDIDFDSMRGVVEVLAHKEFDAYEEAVQGLTPSETFAEVRKQHGDDRDAAREAFWNDPWVQAVKSLAATPSLSDIHEHWKVGAENPRTAYVNARVNAEIASWAVLMDGQWAERGEMGWFGISADEMPEVDWHRQVAELYKSLDPETWVVLVDCHI